MAFFLLTKITKNVVLCWNVTQLNKHDKYSKKKSNKVKEDTHIQTIFKEN